MMEAPPWTGCAALLQELSAADRSPGGVFVLVGHPYAEMRSALAAMEAQLRVDRSERVFGLDLSKPAGHVGFLELLRDSAQVRGGVVLLELTQPTGDGGPDRGAAAPAQVPAPLVAAGSLHALTKVGADVILGVSPRASEDLARILEAPVGHETLPPDQLYSGAQTWAQVLNTRTVHLGALTDRYVERLAQSLSKQGDARDLVSMIGLEWRRSMRLLRRLFDRVARRASDARIGLASASRDEQAALLAIAQREIAGSPSPEGTGGGGGASSYVEAVLNGLSVAQREALANAAKGEFAPDQEEDCRLLAECGLLSATAPYTLLDPALRAHVPRPVVIHHLSDVHFGDNHLRGGGHSRRPGHNAIEQATSDGGPANAYLKHLTREVAAGRAPDLIVVTGDLTETANDEQLAEARAWLDRLDHALGPSPHGSPRVLVIGGNHDVQWMAVPPQPDARHAAFEDKILPTAPGPLPAVRVAAFETLGLEVCLLRSAELGGTADTRSKPEAQELFELYQRRGEDGGDQRYSAKLREIGRIDPGLITIQAIDALRNTEGEPPSAGDAQAATTLRLVALHHPVSPIPDAAAKAFAVLANAADLKIACLERGVSIILHGHEHCFHVSVESWPTLATPRRARPRAPRVRSNRLVIIGAPSLSSSETTEPNGFVELRILREGAVAVELDVTHMKYAYKKYEPDESLPLRLSDSSRLPASARILLRYVPGLDG